MAAIRDKVELEHGYNNADPKFAGRRRAIGQRMFLVYPYAMRFKATWQEGEWLRPRDPAPCACGYERDYSASGPWAFHLTSIYTVVTSMSTEWLRIAHPSVPREDQ